MTQTQLDPNQMITYLMDYMNNPILNLDERNFIRDLRGKTYSRLTRHQKIVLARLYDFIRGLHAED